MMNDCYRCVEGCDFHKKFKKAYKKHLCLEDDFKNLQQTILVDFDKTNSTDQVSGLGEAYADKPVFKSNLMITELMKKAARFIWHPCHERKELLQIDVYLKNMQTNHDADLIKRALDEYYANIDSGSGNVPSS